jgi:hypothetical protein
LQQLATQFTQLQPMQPAQLVTLAALQTTLPPAGSAAPAANPELPGLISPELDAANLQPGDPQAPLVAGGLPLPPPQAPAPAMLASLGAAPTPFASRPAHRVNHSVLTRTELAQAVPAPRPYEVTHSYAPVSVSEPYRSVPMGAQVMSVKASATVPQYVQAAPPAPDSSGSALGMAADLPPPQPLQPGLNN